MRIIAAIAVVGIIAAIAQPASAGMVGDCLQENDMDLRIGGCTAMIRSGEYSGKNLAIAYKNRGLAYNNLVEHRRAIENYDQALRIYPEYAFVYFNRGVAYNDLGEYRRAIESYGRALRINPGFAFAYKNRANSRCRLGLVEASVDDRMQALRLGKFTAADLQSLLRGRGFYKGAVDGDFGLASRKALRDWTAAGCS